MKREDSVLAKFFDGRRYSKSGSTPARRMLTRPYSQLVELRASHGSAFGAALDGAINAEEYLKLERLDE